MEIKAERELDSHEIIEYVISLNEDKQKIDSIYVLHKIFHPIKRKWYVLDSYKISNDILADILIMLMNLDKILNEMKTKSR